MARRNEPRSKNPPGHTAYGVKRPVAIELKKTGDRGTPSGWYAYGLTQDDLNVPAEVLFSYGGPYESKSAVESEIAKRWGPKPKRANPGRRRKRNPAWLLPVAVVGGAVVAGTLVVLGIRRYRKSTALEPGVEPGLVPSPPTPSNAEIIRTSVVVEPDALGGEPQFVITPAADDTYDWTARQALIAVPPGSIVVVSLDPDVGFGAAPVLKGGASQESGTKQDVVVKMGNSGSMAIFKVATTLKWNGKPAVGFVQVQVD